MSLSQVLFEAEESDDVQAQTLARILFSSERCEQPPIAAVPTEELTVALPALALGGAERIVLDWVCGVRNRYPVHLVLVGKASKEYPIPSNIRVTRLNKTSETQIEALGRSLAASANPACLCHLLSGAQRAALRRGGALPVPVIHNARSGWIDTSEELASEPLLIAVSRACSEELRSLGYAGRIMVIRHLPIPQMLHPGLRAHWRRIWGIPQDAVVVGMIGGVKPQKAYPRAVRIVAEFRKSVPDARLVILGGPVGKDGPLAWSALLEQRHRYGLEGKVILPGFVPDAIKCLPAFDVLLNTSRYEGLSIATLEALEAGLPVVASRVGGQGEVEHTALRLLPFEASEKSWVAALERAMRTPKAKPPWATFPAYRQWTLAHLAVPYRQAEHVLFVTANLNAGGAQRSLVNLAVAVTGKVAFSIAVTGDSTSDTFYRELRASGVEVFRSADTCDAFDHAEALIRIVRTKHADIMTFWNVDPKIKLLVAKSAEALLKLKLVDVSPGGYATEEMNATVEFQKLIAYEEADYYRRLDRMVLKFTGALPGAAERGAEIIPNGVRLPAKAKERFSAKMAPKIVLNGRIAPSKFLHTALEAMALVHRRLPKAELHIIGGAEPRHAQYAMEVIRSASLDLGRTVFFHGPDARASETLFAFDAALVLGEHQGCPNACLEALAARVPVVANDSGGTREQVVSGKTGWLLPGTDPAEIAEALLEALTDSNKARRLSYKGCKRIVKKFSMSCMTQAYLRLFRLLRKGG